MALKCYFDGSGKRDRFLTLAAVAGDEEIWPALEADWRSFLAHVGVPHAHMYDVFSKKDVFRGWQKDKRDWFVHALITFFKMHQDRSADRLRAFTSTVDLQAHRDCSDIPGLPDPARMCVRGLVAKVFLWYSAFATPIVDGLELYFDKDERFVQYIVDDWKSEAFRARHPAWGLVRTIEPVEMREHPGIQIADLFGWCRVRIDSTLPGRPSYGPALLLCHPSRADHYVFDREKLKTYPPYSIG